MLQREIDHSLYFHSYLYRRISLQPLFEPVIIKIDSTYRLGNVFYSLLFAETRGSSTICSEPG